MILNENITLTFPIKFWIMIVILEWIGAIYLLIKFIQWIKKMFKIIYSKIPNCIKIKLTKII